VQGKRSHVHSVWSKELSALCTVQRARSSLNGARRKVHCELCKGLGVWRKVHRESSSVHSVRCAEHSAQYTEKPRSKDLSARCTEKDSCTPWSTRRVLCARNMEHSSRCTEHIAMFSVYGTRSRVLSTWSTEQGSHCTVHGARFSV
jgi:hypothetical protein